MFDSIRGLRTYCHEEFGGLTLWNLAWLTVFLGVAGLAVDYASASRTQAQLQASVDSAALAGILDLPNEAAALASARTYLQANYDNKGSLESAIIEVGVYDGPSGAFTTPTPLGQNPNAVRVIASRTGANAVTTYLLKFAGVESLDVAAQAITAASVVAACPSGGFFSKTENIIQSNDRFLKGVCVHGDDLVSIGSDNVFSEDSRISTESGATSTFKQSSSNTISQEPLPLAVNYDFPLLQVIDGVVASLKSGSPQFWPSFLGGATVKVVQDIKLDGVYDLSGNKSALTKNTFYVVQNVAEFEGVIEDIGVYAGKEIKVGSDSTIRDVIFATDDTSGGKISIGSNTAFGRSDICTTGEYSVFLLAANNIEIASSSADMYGVVAGTKAEFSLQSSNANVVGFYAESASRLGIQSNNTFSGCGTALNSPFGTFDGGFSEVGDDFALVR